MAHLHNRNIYYCAVRTLKSKYLYCLIRCFSTSYLSLIVEALIFVRLSIMLSLMHYQITYLHVYVLPFLFVDCSTRVKNVMSRYILIFDIFIYLPYRRILVFGKFRITVSPYPYRRIGIPYRCNVGQHFSCPKVISCKFNFPCWDV